MTRYTADVIVIGELRDLETISLAVTAAETGHLVLATLHTSNAIRTINRLLGVFPPDQLSQIRRMLSESLKVVISQRLVQRGDGRGQVAALFGVVLGHRDDRLAGKGHRPARAMEAVQIGSFDDIVVKQGELTDAEAGQQHRRGAACAAAADDGG